ncbi:LemA family protein [Ferrimonas marina]|uniref:LemA family protein n=1 Tax=Ferrimonas marina TaxID=299255 RepID=UPI0009356111|nr:LemA family protein [Ferrimonas marina]
MDSTLVIVAIVAAVVVMFVISTYNRLVALRNRVGNGFAQIEVQLKRRYDLIPNLVETCKGMMKHERETFEAVVNARNEAAKCLESASGGDAKGVVALAGAEQQLAGALAGMRVAVEAYPDLKANTTMTQLNEEMTSTENKVAFSRQGFNDAVMTYNTAIQSFPANLMAGMFGFQEKAMLEFEDSAQIQAAPKVQF